MPRPEVTAAHRIRAMAGRLREEQARSLELQALLFATETELRQLQADLDARDVPERTED